MAKMGRPKVKNPKLNRVTVRFTDSEYNALKKFANSHNLTLTQAVKKAIDLLYLDE